MKKNSEEFLAKLEKQNKVDNLYMQMAQIWSQNSYAVRRKVGCLIVKDNSVISDGYNGTPSGFPNRCEYDINRGPNYTLTDDQINEIVNSGNINDLVTYEYVLHAESNAIAKLSKSNNSSDGATLYVTDEPCIHCAKMIIQAGIKRVVYGKPYRTHDGIELLKRANIEIKQLII